MRPVRKVPETPQRRKPAKRCLFWRACPNEHTYKRVKVRSHGMATLDHDGYQWHGGEETDTTIGFCEYPMSVKAFNRWCAIHPAPENAERTWRNHDPYASERLKEMSQSIYGRVDIDGQAHIFNSNSITFRTEERLALNIKRPDSFIAWPGSNP